MDRQVATLGHIILIHS